MPPIDLKFCVEIEFLQSTITLGIIDGVRYYESLTEEKGRKYFEKDAYESRDVLEISIIDNLGKQELQVEMKNPNAHFRMKNLLIDKHTLLRQKGLSWLVSEIQKVDEKQVLDAIRHAKLRKRLKSDLAFSNYQL